jgi:dUTP pyrophosphatase
MKENEKYIGYKPPQILDEGARAVAHGTQGGVIFTGNPEADPLFNKTIYDPYPFTVPVGIKRINPEAEIPVYNKRGDSGYDLVAMEDVIILPGETALIPTGLAFETPLGLEVQIRPRSGLSAKTKSRVTLGTGDSNYRGELKVNMDNITQIRWEFNQKEQSVVMQTSDELVTLENYPVSIHDIDPLTKGLIYEDGDLQEIPVGSIIVFKGQRVAQGVLASVWKGIFTEKEVLSETERGTTGFGHTGV